ncbi:hypothetical protein C8R48DRAFT_758684 [Suillus tomentosus]|nr:hypothetical protein C8R48DRAFT_758684 [Suillus tomentosus]
MASQGDLGVGEASMMESVIIFDERVISGSFREETLEKKRNYDRAVSKKDDALTRLREAHRDIESRHNESAYGMMRAEIEHLEFHTERTFWLEHHGQNTEALKYVNHFEKAARKQVNSRRILELSVTSPLPGTTGDGLQRQTRGSKLEHLSATILVMMVTP